jgi:hypothetical protein
MSMTVSVTVPEELRGRVEKEVGAEAAPTVIKTWLEAICRHALSDDSDAAYTLQAAEEAAGLADWQNDDYAYPDFAGQSVA